MKLAPTCHALTEKMHFRLDLYNLFNDLSIIYGK